VIDARHPAVTMVTTASLATRSHNRLLEKTSITWSHDISTPTGRKSDNVSVTARKISTLIVESEGSTRLLDIILRCTINFPEDLHCGGFSKALPLKSGNTLL
jgi:hypothetical protein